MDGTLQRRYVITSPSRDRGIAEVATLLGSSGGSVLNAMTDLASDRPISSADVLTIPEIGVAAAPLSDQQVAELEAAGFVVEDDIEVHALPYQDWGHGGAAVATGDPQVEHAFQSGYQQGLAAALGGGFGAAGTWPGGFDRSGRGTAQAPAPTCPPGMRLVFGPIGVSCVQAPDGQPIPWNIAMVNAPAAWRRTTGRGVKVAVLDTGIDQDHPDLTVAGGVSFIGGVSSWDDDHGHGTHCAGTVAARNNPVGVVGVAPNASLFAVKVLNGGGSGSLSGIVAGMAWATQQRMDVISMSLGSNVSNPDAPCLTAYQRAAEDFLATGGVIVAAAGNNGTEFNRWVGQPARCPGYIAVAAVDRDANVAGFSSFGPGNVVALAAPGVAINSTFKGGGYRESNGTSMACPHVAGAAALLKEMNPGWDAAQIRTRLTATARDLGPTGADEKSGAGLLDCSRAVFG
jgi:subtilisin